MSKVHPGSSMAGFQFPVDFDPTTLDSPLSQDSKERLSQKYSSRSRQRPLLFSPRLSYKFTAQVPQAAARFIFPDDFQKQGSLPRPLSKSLAHLYRDNKIIRNGLSIKRRLNKELSDAKTQQLKEEDNPFFQPQKLEYCPLEINSDLFRVGHYSGAVASTQGFRLTMEDTHLATSFDTIIGEKKHRIGVFAVFDGHGGTHASIFCKQNLVYRLNQQLKTFCPRKLTDVGIWNALKLTCVNLSRAYADKRNTFSKTDGCTATIAIKIGEDLWFANVGDSRIVLDNGGVPIQVTEDAKPDMPKYQRGIEKRNGRVLNFGIPRVEGILAVARAIGDINIQGVTSRPKITKISLKDLKSNSHVVLACDGLWDVSSSNQVATYVHESLHQPLQVTCEKLIQAALGARSLDNISIMIIKVN